MGIPKKALRESQLQFLTAGPAVSTSHQISRVKFIEHGVEKTAFYKKIDPSDYYPELLAKISVAVSILKRFFQGLKSAEERLVYDDSNRLIGTTSLTVDGFQSFNFADDPVPVDPAVKERAIPGTKTLLEKNIIETLFGRWFLNDDDSHPHNLGTAENEGADIDFDMFIYWLTIYMKKPRPVIGVPKKGIEFSTEDWENFPDIRDAKLYHWPTYDHPGEQSIPAVLPATLQSQLFSTVLPKPYSDPGQFKALAASPVAHQQKFAAAMKALMTHQPERVRARLYEQFGDTPLNYTSLDEATRIKYEEEFPDLFNEKTNTLSFVDFMMQIYQLHYDEMYKKVVPYVGCKRNRHGLSLKSTSSTLYNMPSVHTTISAWMDNQNKTLLKDEDPNIQYDLNESKKRYHQIWRDAYTPRAGELLDRSYNLVYEVLRKSSAPANHAQISQLIGTKVVDQNIRDSIQFFGKRAKLSWQEIEPLLSVDDVSGLKSGLKLLVEFTTRLDELTRSYYSIEREHLTEEDNLVFARGLKSLHEEYELPIRQNLSCTTPDALEFSQVAQKLEKLGKRVNFKVHLTTTDEMMAATANKLVPLSDERLIQQFKTTLFHWAESLKKEEFNKQINNIIDNKYNRFAHVTRHRAIPVKNYLSSTQEESNSTKLAYILSSGKEEGALNTDLIESLTPLLVNIYPSLFSIKEAIRLEKEGTRPAAFSAYLSQYTKEAVAYGKKELTHSFGPKGVALFHQAMYEWLDSLSDTQFHALVYSALNAHLDGSWLNWIGITSRKEEVDNYFKILKSHSKIAANIFVHGKEESGLNTMLFNKIITTMKQDINSNPEMQVLPQYKYILNYTNEDDLPNYLKSLKSYAEAQTHTQEKPEAILVSEASSSYSFN